MGIPLDETARPVPHSGKYSLENAASAVDLLVAVRDVVLALKHMFLEEDILHKHIGYDTIRMESGGVDARYGGIKGVVVDLDYPNSEEGSSRNPQGLGTCRTYAFQSDQQLFGHGDATRESQFYDDLQSVFYVLCWACYGYDHRGRPDKFRPAWMTEWESTRYAHTASTNKQILLSKKIPSHVNRYMGCHRDIMEGVIERLRKTLMDCTSSSDPETLYAATIEILETGISKTSQEQCGSANQCSKVATLVGAITKRKLPETSEDPFVSCKRLKGEIRAVVDTHMDDE
ncbi:hypothetical protein B0H11DRAFT_2210711 [Mycena galericulata]|nr:hypothetical protein B0H11DRAFT_2210711 [Mycena galericulata]